MKVNAQCAQKHFSDQISAASKGEEAEIELHDQPAPFLIALEARYVLIRDHPPNSAVVLSYPW